MIMKYIMLIIIVIATDINIVSAHPERAAQCMYCHDKLGQGFGWSSDDEDECGGCHAMQPDTHNPRICKVCHQIKDKDDYHLKHVNVTCDKCHDGTQKPNVVITSCTSCHAKPIHETHEDIQNQCSNCHGGIASSRTESLMSILETQQVSNTITTIESLRPYTVSTIIQFFYEILKRGTI